MRYYILLFVVQIAINYGCCQSVNKILGDWRVESGSIIENYGWPSFKKFNINIALDSITTQSGFFYAIDDLTIDNPRGRFPFVYYGNKEKCELENDSIFIYSKPYKLRDAYFINFLDNNNVCLIGIKGEIYLSRIHPLNKKGKRVEIDYVKVAIENYDIYKVSYSVNYSNDYSMQFKGVIDSTARIQEDNLKLAEDSFEERCKLLINYDVKRIRSIYKSTASDYATIFLEVGLINGKKIKSELHIGAIPPDLEMALAPFLYGHQSYFYSTLPPQKWMVYR